MLNIFKFSENIEYIGKCVNEFFCECTAHIYISKLNKELCMKYLNPEDGGRKTLRNVGNYSLIGTIYVPKKR